MSYEALYELYTHWGVGNRNEDIEEWERRERNHEWLMSQPVITYLHAARESLDDLLRNTHGVLNVFFDPGWKLALKPDLDLDERRHMEQARAYSDAVLSSLSGVFFQSPVKILNVATVAPFIRALHKRHRSVIYRWFVGETGEGAYDSPKVVEAFFRARLIGAGIPVFRVDWDALVNVEDHRFQRLGITEDALRASLDREDTERKRLVTRTWVCSAGYQTPGASTYDEWSRGFATRIQPALRAEPEMCRLVYGTHFGLLHSKIEVPAGGLSVDDITKRCWDQDLAERYLGVKQSSDGSWVETEHESSIATLGAHPLYAVVSGALLNLSTGAILDLPPFSNMIRGVMWIDDHLKYELHKALGHFRYTGEPCRLSSSFTVVKGRSAPQPNLAAYTWASYLPTLLLGLVMDAWIRKEREKDEERPLVKALREAITGGIFDRRIAMQLERALRDVAIERIRKVHSAWSALMDPETNRHTLASAWATSHVADLAGKALQTTHPHIRFNEESRGLGLVATAGGEIRAISDLRPPIADALRELIWDAVEYIDLTLRWPGMIQTIRAVEKQGIFDSLS